MGNRFAVIGHPLGHTMSPFIHERLFSLSGMDARYEAMDTAPDRLDDTVSLLRQYDGFNITIPHKQAVIPLLDGLDRSAEIYRAVNTVQNREGRLIGYNTDADGFRAALALCGIPLSGRVLICGAGGVARTIAIESVLAGCEVTVAVRNSDSAGTVALRREIAGRFSAEITVCRLSEVAQSYDLAVNGTPVGMYPNIDGAVLTDRQLTKIGHLFDTVYNPEKTMLTVRAAALGIPAASGMGMLVMQAAKAHEYWYGAAFQRDDMLQLIADANREMGRRFS